MILQRIRYYWRQLLVLLVATSIITTFFVIEPLYAGVLVEQHWQQTRAATTRSDYQITLTGSQPLHPQTADALSDHLGDLLMSIELFKRTVGIDCGDPFINCYQLTAYEKDISEYFTLVEGRLPTVLPAPDSQTETQVEAVITRLVQERSGKVIGDIITFNRQRPVRLQIVGIVEPTDATAPFWSAQVPAITGIYTEVGDNLRYDFGLITPPEAFDTYAANSAEQGVLYSWSVQTNPDSLNEKNLQQRITDLQGFERSFLQLNPAGESLNNLLEILTRTRAEMDAAERPMFSLAALLLGVMLAYLCYLVILFLPRQEIALWQQRGASLPQLWWLHLQTQLGVVILALLISLLLAPLLVHLSGYTPVLTRDVIPYALAASGLSLLVMLLALVMQPYLRPYFYTRYLVDVGLLLLGTGLLLRLYFISSDNLMESLQNLVRDPLRLPGQMGAQLGESSSLGDPVNLIGPFLMIIGLGLLFLRGLPRLFRLLTPLTGRTRGLILPLATWNNSRAQHQHSSLLLLLMITLALGAAALSLRQTQQDGAWAFVQEQLGASARLRFAPQAAPQAWTALPDVQSAETVMRLEDSSPSRITVLGLEPGKNAALAEAARLESGGMPLPADATVLRFQGYSPPDEAGGNMLVGVTVELQDAAGVRVRLYMNREDETAGFTEYRIDLPAPTLAPWRLRQFLLSSLPQGYTESEHSFYLDELAVENASAVTTVLDDFEAINAEPWRTPPEVNQAGTVVLRSEGAAAQGTYSLRIRYRTPVREGYGIETAFPVSHVSSRAVPVVMSSSLAQFLAEREGLERPLTIGTEGVVELYLPSGAVNLNYRLVDILPEYRTLTDNQRFMLAATPDLQLALNPRNTLEDYYAWNEAWLEFPTRRPSEAFVAALEDTPDLQETVFAWDRYHALQAAPLAQGIIDIMTLGFWLVLLLMALTFACDVLMDSAFSASQPLRVMGWSGTLWQRWLVVERLLPVACVVIVGAGLGAILAYLLLPFLTLIRADVLYLPWQQVVILSSSILVLMAGLLMIFSRGIGDELY